MEVQIILQLTVLSFISSHTKKKKILVLLSFGNIYNRWKNSRKVDF